MGRHPTNYRKINIELTSQLVEGRLERRHLCKCRNPFIREEILLGKRYTIDINTLRWARLTCGSCGAVQNVVLADCWEEYTLYVSWFPVELLDIFPALRLPPIPKLWVPVRDNKVRPVRELGRLI